MNAINFTGHTLTIESLLEADKALEWLRAEPAAVSLQMPVTTIDGTKIPALLEKNGKLVRL